MIKLQMTIKSTILLRPVQIFAFIPHGFFTSSWPYKTIWLLHTAISDGSMFTEQASLLEIANQKGYALIAPSLGNGYFANTAYEKQALFLAEELLPAMRQALSISSKIEDNALLGVSMGGFGAIRWALDMPGIFSSVAAIATHFGLSIPEDERLLKSKDLRPLYQIFVKGEMSRLLLDKNGNLHPSVDLFKLLSQAKSQGSIPRMGLYCGESDWLAIEQTKAFFGHCQEEEIQSELFISEGSHNSDYWNHAILEAVEWIFAKN